MAHEELQQGFPIGQLVRFVRARPNVARGEYEVVRQLPTRLGERQYRIKSALEQFERVAMEEELEPMQRHADLRLAPQRIL
jgi:hypothetical protein